MGSGRDAERGNDEQRRAKMTSEQHMRGEWKGRAGGVKGKSERERERLWAEQGCRHRLNEASLAAVKEIRAVK